MRDVLTLQSVDVETGACGASARLTLFLDASRAHCRAEATSEMAIELPPGGQVKGESGHPQSCVVESLSCAGLCTVMTSLSRMIHRYLGSDDGEHKTVTILNRLVTW